MDRKKSLLLHILSTSHTSKRSNKNIHLTFTNAGKIIGETAKTCNNDNLPVKTTCENVEYDNNEIVFFVN